MYEVLDWASTILIVAAIVWSVSMHVSDFRRKHHHH
jgi:hypothetical protein